jgi:hypothetical protein
MSGTTTTYAIEILYRTKDQASPAHDKIGASADRAARSTGGLMSALRGVGTALVGYGALRVGKSLFIDFNSSIEQSTISLAAQEKMLLGGQWDTAMTHANQLFLDYQQVAKASVGETKDFLDMHKMIASSAMQAGVEMEQLKEMTVGATIAAAALGEESAMVALDVKQMLAGTVGARDRTAQILLASQGISQSKFNASSSKKRASITMAALNDPALKSAAKAMGESFAGVTSTLKDNIQIAMGKIGLPLFKQITAEVQKWNAWIEKNPDKIRQWATDFTSALAKGFEMVKSIAGFIVDNRELLMSLAKAYMIGKGVGLVSGSIGGIVQSLAALNGANGLAGLVKGVGGLSVVLAAVTTGAILLADHVDRTQDRNIQATADWSILSRSASEQDASKFGIFSGRDQDFMAQHGMDAAQRRLDQRFLGQARHEGVIRNGAIDYEGVRATGKAAGVTTNEVDNYIRILDGLLTNAAWASAAKGLTMLNDQIVRLPTLVPQAMTALADPAGLLLRGLRALPNVNNKDDAAKGKKGDDKPAINIQIHMTEDPDRFAVALNGAAVDTLKNPRGARSVWPERR